jgi:putative two-component system response regulator
MMTRPNAARAKVLIVEDKGAPAKVLQLALAQAGYRSVTSTTIGSDAAVPDKIGHYDLVVVDAHHLNADELMKALRALEPRKPSRVVTATVTNDFGRAPVLSGGDGLHASIGAPLDVHKEYKRLRNHNNYLKARLRTHAAALRDSYREAISTMVRAAELKDNDTGQHSHRIGLYCEELATRLGMDHQFRDEILYASPMHDIGKIAIPDHILQKPGGFTASEWATMQTHAAHGAQILSNQKSPYLKMGVDIALCHHERWDGSGYPNQLAGETIPLAARIMTICDVYDACRSQRPYKREFDHRVTLEIMRRGDGRTMPAHFDPAILQAFLNAERAFEEIYEANRQVEANGEIA